jgi:DNA replication licensing factor MCM5
MSGFDANRVYNVSVYDQPDATSPDTPSEAEKLLLDFLLQYRVGGEFIYRSVLVNCVLPSVHSESVHSLQR